MKSSRQLVWPLLQAESGLSYASQDYRSQSALTMLVVKYASSVLCEIVHAVHMFERGRMSANFADD